MKQRIRVVGIVKEGDDVLLLKREMGRLEEAPVWELPTGKIRFGEQPEEAMARAFDEYLGVAVTSLRLVDVITFVALAGASQLSNLYIVYEVELTRNAKIAPADRYVSYRYLPVGQGAAVNGVRLDEASVSVLAIEAGKILVNEAGNKRTKEVMGAAGVIDMAGGGFRSVANAATVYIDGGSRGNPGPSGIGYYIVGENGHVLKMGGEFIGFATSRVAEYYGLKEGCEQALELGLKRVRFVSDSLMMVNQMNGVYTVKNKDLLPIYNDIQNLLRQFEAVAFVHVKREQNVEADAQVNIAIDRHFGLKNDNDGGLL